MSTFETKNDPLLPPEIEEAARVLTRWADNHDHQFWQILGVCDRRFALYKEIFDQAPVKPMPPCQPEPDSKAPSPDLLAYNDALKRVQKLCQDLQHDYLMQKYKEWSARELFSPPGLSLRD